MTRAITAFAAGLLFAIGLGISGMTNPAKVAGFLDLAGAWDPSLAFVMVGAIGVFLPAYRYGKSRPESANLGVYRLPTAPVFDAKLVGGSIVFGIGWGLAGYCPGPAIVASGASLIGAGGAPVVFVASMIVGMVAFEAFARMKARAAEDASARGLDG